MAVHPIGAPMAEVAPNPCKPSSTGSFVGRNFMILAAIAEWLVRDYALSMRLGIPCRWLGLCLVVALTLGLAGHGFAAAQMEAKMMTAAAADVMSSSSDNGCTGCSGGDDGMSSAGCFAVCGGAVAVLPAVPLVKSIAGEPAVSLAVPSYLGHVGPPDPFPPRPSVLS